MKPLLSFVALLGAWGALAQAAEKPQTNKTLVVWVAAADLTQQGGSALTLQSGDQFDAIVLGERARGKWMAGSDSFRRTQGDQSANAVETAGSTTLVQMAIVYHGDKIRLYRNGELYAAYNSRNVDLLDAGNHIAVFGLRHVGANSGTPLAGAIDDARIYGRALTAQEIQSLKPNQPSEIQPLAWWDFEGNAAKDRAGHYAHHALVGMAKLQGGRLVLDGNSYLLAARSDAELKQALRRDPAFNTSIPDPTRPTYHLISSQANGHCADPNFTIFWKGKYHLFYISQGYAHVSSTDLLHWRRHRPFPGPLCSGGIVVAKDGRPTAITTSAWQDGKPVLYTALDDDLEKWSAPVPIEAKVRPGQDTSKMVCWDPDIWVDGNTTYVLQGVHPLIAGKEATVLKSTDQKRWEYVGPFLSREMPDVMRNSQVPRQNEDISCPNFFPIGDKWMLLCISHIHGCRYYLGDWKNEQFTPTVHGRMNWCLSEGMKQGDHGGEVFAPESLLTPDGRRVMWAWLFASSRKYVGPTWKEVFSLPRELSLPKDGVLRIKPLRELEQLRGSLAGEKQIVVEDAKPYRLKDVAGDAIEILATIQQGDATCYGLRVLCDKANGKGIDVSVEPAAKRIRLGATTAPLELKPGEDIQLRVFVDRSVVEVFANDRQAVVKQHEYAAGDVGVCLFSEGGKMNVREVHAWRMAATNP